MSLVVTQRPQVSNIVLALVIVMGAVAPVWAERPEAFNAYERGEYATALTEGRPLAEHGDPEAQVMLGMMYEEGRGVPQNYHEAAKWYRLAAHKGHPLAQINLGELYEFGQGVTRDAVQALMWYSVARAAGYQDGVKWTNRLAPQMTPAQVTEAQQLAQKWKPASK